MIKDINMRILVRIWKEYFTSLPKYYLLIIVATCLAGCKSGVQKSKLIPADRKPNIVFILIDDMGTAQLGCYGSKYYQTINIDHLAESGLRFTDAYSVAAVCSPTRAGLMTGKYPARLHITDFIPGNPGIGYPLKEPDWQKFLPLEEITIGEIMQSNGYQTALFGKWHLSKDRVPPGSLEQNPDKQGFNEIFITHKPSPSLPLGSWQTAEKDAHNVDTLTSRAIDFIERNKNRLFFLIISHNSIHDPLMESSDLISKYKNLPVADDPASNPVIGAMVEILDKSVGRIIEKIEDAGLLGNTLIVFYSDNGGKHSYAAQTPFRTGKGWLYEGGIRVPLIISWQGIIQPGTVSNQMVSSIDFFDTFLDVAGIHDTLQNRDGISFFNLLTDQSYFIDRQTLYWNYPHYHEGSGMRPACAIRDGNYKLIQWHEETLLKKEGALELYDLEKDPGENNNLVKEYPEKAAELLDKLEKWKMETRAQEPVINNNYLDSSKISE